MALLPRRFLCFVLGHYTPKRGLLEMLLWKQRRDSIDRTPTFQIHYVLDFVPEDMEAFASVKAHHFIAATACQEADYGWMIRHYCLKQFQLSMEGIGQRLWCDWDETVGTYGELTNCTALIAERLDCYWPNRLVDEFFVSVHKQYFRNCSRSGRALHDPPNSVLCPFILLPVLVTLLMTALVVWRSKRSEGIV